MTASTWENQPTPPPAGGTSANLFVPVQAHRLTSISCKAIQSFLAERAHSQSAVAAQPGLSLISWADFFGLIFPQSLLVIHVFGTGFNDVSDLTDDMIKEQLKELSSGSNPDSSDEALPDVKRNVRLDVAEPDPHAPSQLCGVLQASRLGFLQHCTEGCYKAHRRRGAVVCAQVLCRRLSSTREEPSQGRLLRILGLLGRASRGLRVFQALRWYHASQKDVRGKKTEHGELLQYPLRELWERRRPANYRRALTRSAPITTSSRTAGRHLTT